MLLDPHRDPDHHQNLIVCCWSHPPPVRKFSPKSFDNFLSYPANRQTSAEHNSLAEVLTFRDVGTHKFVRPNSLNTAKSEYQNNERAPEYLITDCCWAGSRRSGQWLKWSCEAGDSPDEARLEQTPNPFHTQLIGVIWA